MAIRLDRFLSCCDGLQSRSEIKKLIYQGRVSVNGFACKDPGYYVDPGKSFVELDGEPAIYRKYAYIMMNKPPGVLSASSDRERRTVMDILPEWCRKRGMVPVGRLDVDTAGLIFITDDGGFNHDMTSPRRRVEKVYRAVIDSPVTQGDVDAFAGGMRFKDFVAEIARLKPLGQMEDGRYLAEAVLTEGRYHQVKRMFLARGKNVLELQRVAIGPVWLDESLRAGGWREFTLSEREALNIITEVQ